MNKYEIRVNNAIMTAEGLNEWSAMKSLCIFKEIGNLIDFVKTTDENSDKAVWTNAWIYQVELNGSLTLAYIKRIA